MDDTLHNLGWLRFLSNAFIAALGIFGGIVANQILSANSPDAWGFALAVNFVLIPVIVLMLLSRVPYRTDEFERRLRNWSMTQSAVWVLIGGVITRFLTEFSKSEASQITIYIMPATFFLVHALYSQYLRFKIATGGRNAFSDGSCL